MSLASRVAAGIGGFILVALFALSMMAPEFLPTPEFEHAYKGPTSYPPFGADGRGIPLILYAAQGARVVLIPSILSGLLVMVMAIIGGLVRCAGLGWVDNVLQAFSELLGSLPRLVVVLVVALMLPHDMKLLLPIGLTWALLAAPGAMDEAAATAGRLGGERFVEALRAHGFSGIRIYLYHVVWLNLKPVIVRQGAEVTMQVVFLEIALSYLALRMREPSFTHPDSQHSWATLLYQGYTALLGVDLMHSLGLGMLLVAAVAIMSEAFRFAVRAR